MLMVQKENERLKEYRAEQLKRDQEEDKRLQAEYAARLGKLTVSLSIWFPLLSP